MNVSDNAAATTGESSSRNVQGQKDVHALPSASAANGRAAKLSKTSLEEDSPSSKASQPAPAKQVHPVSITSACDLRSEVESSRATD